MAEYDPMDYETWPEDQQEFAGRVVFSLRDGNPRPLAEYLRAGHYVEPVMAAEIADMIEGAEWSSFRLVVKGRKRGQRGWSQRMEAHDRRMALGIFVEDRLQQLPRGSYDAVVLEAQEKFGAKPTAAAEALAYVRDYVCRSDTAPGFDLWAHLRAFYSAP